MTPRLRSGPSFAGLRIGLMGGSFNPAHEGHRDISLYALKRLKLDQIWWLASPQNPLKSSHGMESLQHRLNRAMAAARHPKIIVSDIERQLGTRYTFDTLRALRQRFSGTHFVWLMGSDNLQQRPAWHKGLRLFELVPVAVFRRPPYAAGRRSGKAAQRFEHAWLRSHRARSLALLHPPAWMILDNRHNRLSATAIRRSTNTKKG
jgi:nicotinate-nucleotide adenylyltransferase